MNSRELFIVCTCFVFCFETLVAAKPVGMSGKKGGAVKTAVAGTDSEDSDEDALSIWESDPIEINAVNVQVLDKISGKVLKKRIKVGEQLKVGGIKVTLKRCFKNAPEDSREIYAFIEISENKSIFSKWLFASSPSINLFEHPQYDVRVGF